MWFVEYINKYSVKGNIVILNFCCINGIIIIKSVKYVIFIVW